MAFAAAPLASTGAARPEETQSAPLLVHDLLLSFAELASLLRRELEAGSVLDAFLLGAAMNQVAEDCLHRDFWRLHRIAVRLEPHAGRLGRGSALALRRVCSAGLRLRGAVPAERKLRVSQSELAMLVRRLGAELTHEQQSTRVPEALAADGRAVLARLSRLPRGVLESVARLPTCFRSLDQQPEDCRRVVQDFVVRRPDRAVELLLVGLRTSGSYLAPLYAAFLEQEGYGHVTVMTYRPEQPSLAADRRTMALMARCGGLALLTDDPPNTGASLAATAEALERRGLGRDSILVLLPTFGDGTPPARLQPYETLPLPWRRWAIHERLAAPAVRAALSRLLPGRTIQLSPAQGGHQRVTVGSVVAVERLELAPLADVKVGSPVRRHVRALFRAQIVDGETGAQFEHHVYVKGAGLGYLGRHSLAVAEPLADFLPEVYGVDGGLLFRAWLPEAGRLSCPSTEGEAAVAERIAAYVAARRRALATPEDRSRGLGGLNPLWQRAANLLDPAFGRAGLLMRPLLGRVTRRMFAVKHPSVIDGSMALSQWFAPSPAGAAEAAPLLKADYDERAFSNQDTLLDQIYSYDAVYDLASAAADAELDPDLAAHGFPELLRRAYEAMTGDGVAAERWFLYQVLCLAGHQKFLTSMLTQAPADVSFAALSADPAYARAMEATLVDGITRAQRALARVQQHCLTRQFLADTETPEAGPLCGIDIDGVLETVWLGFPASTPAGCLALRALLRHGCRPLLVSGRSLDEVRERCIAYRLPGGVAEYGAVTYVHAAGSVRELLSDLQRADLNSLRETLRGIEGVYVDPDYQRAVRAYRFGRDGRRHALKRETVEAALANSGTRDRLRVIAGNAQTDFMAAGTDKGTGLGVLVSELTQHDDSALHSGGGKPLVLAVGDTSSDLPMFELARLACAPALADDEAIAPGVKRMQGRYQAGLAEAAGLLLGHRPGACPVCRPPSPSAEAELLLTILAAQDTGYRGKLRQALRLLRQQARRPREP